jgi:hypothetical protein
MKNKWKTLRMGAMLFALPIVATAAASAHQFLTDNAPIAEATASMVSNSGAISVQRSHTISLNESGSIEGRVATIDAGSQANGLSDLKVFLVNNGDIQAETVTDAEGLFTLSNIGEGVYSFVATGESGFAAYGVRVVANNGSDTVNLMEAAAVSPQAAVVKRILQKQLPSDIAQEILDNAVVSEEASQVVGSNKVSVKDGTLVGHVVPMLGEVALVDGTSVFLIQGNEQVAEVTADSTGSFAIEDVEPGVYDFVAAGPTGFAAVSFEAVEDSAIAQDVASVVTDSEEIPVSLEPAVGPVAYQDIPADIPFDGGIAYDGGVSDSLDVCLTCQQDAGFVGEQVSYAGDEVVYEDAYESTPIEYAGESCGCGAAAGGSCGSASNFSGYSTCGSCNTSCCNKGGLFSRFGRGGGGGLFGGGAGVSRFARIGLLAGVATAIAVGTDSDDEGGSPDGS